jgi:hypothetical protein
MDFINKESQFYSPPIVKQLSQQERPTFCLFLQAGNKTKKYPQSSTSKRESKKSPAIKKQERLYA